MTKFDKWFSKFLGKLFYNTPEGQFKELKSLIAPKTIYSKTLGIPESDIALKHIRKGIDISRHQHDGYFKFIMPEGTLVPLSPFYKKKYVTINDHQHLYMNERSEFIDSYKPFYKDTPYEHNQDTEQKIEEEKRFKKIQEILHKKYTKNDE